ncbi:MAG: tetratricopeptide repeat protein [Ignavibacterium sp.]|nr:tetratricopeptide repeat protein [Ignavibacterium sp.]
MITVKRVVLVLIFFFTAAMFAQDKEMNTEAGKLFNEGNALLKAGNYNGAIEKYDAALKIEKDYRIYYQKGISLRKSNKNEEAKNSFEESLKLNPNFEASYNALGGVYFSMGDFTKSIEKFEKILEMKNVKANVKDKVKSNMALAYSRLGNESLSKGEASRGIDYLKKAVEHSNYDAAYLSLAKVYSETGQYDESIKAAENALKYRSKISKGGPYFYMGIAYKGKGNNTKAREMFAQAQSDATYRKTAEYELGLLK